MSSRRGDGNPSRRFTSRLERAGTKRYVEVPFDPATVWGTQERYYVRGTVAGQGIRGVLRPMGDQFILPLGPAWLRDHELPDEESVEVLLGPDGPQSGALAADIVAALDASPKARVLFQSIAPFYRKNFIRWIEQAKRAETRSARIREMVALLEEGKIRR